MYKINIPSKMPRVITALQFGFFISMIFTLLFVGVNTLVYKMPLTNITQYVIVFVVGFISISPIFYTRDKVLGLDELRRGEYTATEAIVLEHNNASILLKLKDKNVALMNPLVFDLDVEHLKPNESKVLYIKTTKGHSFLTKVE